MISVSGFILIKKNHFRWCETSYFKWGPVGENSNSDLGGTIGLKYLKSSDYEALGTQNRQTPTPPPHHTVKSPYVGDTQY